MSEIVIIFHHRVRKRDANNWFCKTAGLTHRDVPLGAVHK